MMGFEESSQTSGSSNMEVLGQVMWLMSQSPLHRRWHIESMYQWVIPAMMYKQFRIYKRGQKPVAYVSWAKLSEEKESAYVMSPRALQPVDWQSGDRIWIVDHVSPFGATNEVNADLRNNLFKDDIGRALRVKPGSEEMRIIYVHGANAVKKARDRSINPAVGIPDYVGPNSNLVHPR